MRCIFWQFGSTLTANLPLFQKIALCKTFDILQLWGERDKDCNDDPNVEDRPALIRMNRERWQLWDVLGRGGRVAVPEIVEYPTAADQEPAQNHRTPLRSNPSENHWHRSDKKFTEIIRQNGKWTSVSSSLLMPYPIFQYTFLKSDYKQIHTVITNKYIQCKKSHCVKSTLGKIFFLVNFVSTPGMVSSENLCKSWCNSRPNLRQERMAGILLLQIQFPSNRNIKLWFLLKYGQLGACSEKCEYWTHTF